MFEDCSIEELQSLCTHLEVTEVCIYIKFYCSEDRKKKLGLTFQMSTKL